MAEGTQEVVEKSADTTTPGGEAAPGASKADAAASGGAAPEKGGEKTQGEDAAPKTPLEAAQRVMAKEAKDVSAKPQDGEQSPTKATEDAKPKEGEAAKGASEDDVPPAVKSSPAYKKLSSENRILQVAKEKNEQAIKDLEPKAKVYEDLSTFIKQGNLSSEDFQSGLTIMRALKMDPPTAYKMLVPVMKELEAAVGVTLPQDLEVEVEAGTISRERAQELSRARADAAIATEDEWRIMKQHPTFAHQMLSPIQYLRSALDIPYCHHEKWDGSGYPRGLQGESIPKAARVFAVVDVWDALISDRPYRKAWTREQALNHIRDQSGKHFDPAVVNAFMLLPKD